jgi:hypothetical protein
LKQGNDIKKGFLVDIRRAIFNKKCYGGEVLHSSIEIAKSFSGFSVVNGRLERAGDELAAGTFKLWVPEDNRD